MLTILLGNNFSPHGGTGCLSDGSTGCIFLSQGSKHRVVLLLLLVLRLFVNVGLLRIRTRAFSGGSRRLNIRFTSLLLLVHSRQVWNFLLLLRSLPLSALGLVGVGALPLIRMRPQAGRWRSLDSGLLLLLVEVLLNRCLLVACPFQFGRGPLFVV